MMFYNKKRVYYSLRAVATGAKLIVQVNLGNTRCFASFTCIGDFCAWYNTIPDAEKTISEVITSDIRKLVIDIDDDERDIFYMYDFKRHLQFRIGYVFAELDIGCPNVLVYDICGDGKISYHVVVSNFSFSARTCQGLCTVISGGQVWDCLVDKGVYKSVQCIRIEGSTKPGERRWKRILGPQQSIDTGLISIVDKTERSDLVLDISYPCRRDRLWAIDTSSFRVRFATEDTVFLDRIRASYCAQCKRVHTRENAFIRYGEFTCWRARK